VFDNVIDHRCLWEIGNYQCSTYVS